MQQDKKRSTPEWEYSANHTVKEDYNRSFLTPSWVITTGRMLPSASK